MDGGNWDIRGLANVPIHPAVMARHQDQKKKRNYPVLSMLGLPTNITHEMLD